MNTLNDARKYREIIEAAMTNVDDQQASEAPRLFPKLSDSGLFVEAGTRINWNGVIKRAAVGLWDTAENNPDNAPTLWEDINYREGYRIIPETITAGLAFSHGECGWWKGVLYQSVVDSNVWTPEQYATGWIVVD